MGRSIDFRVIAFDEASREFRKVGDEALKMAAEVRAADAAMADSHAKAGLSAYRHAKAFDKAAREIEQDASKVENRVKTAWGEVIKASDKMDRSLVNMWHRSNPWMKLFLASLPLLPPLLNSAAVATGGLASAIVSAGFGLGVLAAGIKANLSAWAQARHFADSQGNFKLSNLPAIQKFATATQPIAFQVLDTLLKSLNILLPKLTPVFNAFASKFIEFLHGINQDMNGPGFAKFLNWVQTVGAYNFGNILDSVKNLAVGIAHLSMDFTGQGMSITKWLDDITAKFAHWAKVLPNTAGWKSFLDMFHQDGPLVRDIFKQLADLLPKILGALAPLSHMTLTVLDDILKFANKLKPSTIDNIVKSLVALKLAMTALSIASKGKTIMGMLGLGGAAAGEGGAEGDATGGAGPWILGIAAAVLGLGIAYKTAWSHSSRFRAEQRQMFAEMNKGWGATKQATSAVEKYGQAHKAAASMVGKDRLAGHAFWTDLMKVGAYAIAGMVTQLARFLHGIAQFLTAIGHIPGFGWATAAGRLMDNAAKSALGLARAIAGIHSKTVSVNVHYNTYRTTVDTLIQQNRTVGTYGMARAPKYHATGGRPDVGRASWVGEQGPELFVPDSPGKIIPHRESMKMAGGGSHNNLAKAVAKALEGIQIKLIDSDGNGRRAYLISGKNF